MNHDALLDRPNPLTYIRVAPVGKGLHNCNRTNTSMSTAKSKNTGKWVVVGLIVISLVLTILRWMLIPRTNPRATDPGSPYYSTPGKGE